MLGEYRYEPLEGTPRLGKNRIQRIAKSRSEDVGLIVPGEEDGGVCLEFATSKAANEALYEL